MTAIHGLSPMATQIGPPFRGPRAKKRQSGGRVKQARVASQKDRTTEDLWRQQHELLAKKKRFLRVAVQKGSSHFLCLLCLLWLSLPPPNTGAAVRGVGNWPQNAQETQKQLLNLELGRTEVHEQSVALVRRSEVAENLSGVFVCRGLARLQFDQHTILHNQIGKIIAEDGSVFIGNLQRSLLFHV